MQIKLDRIKFITRNLDTCLLVVFVISFAISTSYGVPIGLDWSKVVQDATIYALFSLQCMHKPPLWLHRTLMNNSPVYGNYF